MKKKVSKILKAMVPALLLWSPGFASSLRSVSRFRTKSVAVTSEAARKIPTAISGKGETDPFAVFGESIKPENPQAPRDNGEVLDFLRSQGLLSTRGEEKSSISGDLEMGRKDFSACMCFTSMGSTTTYTVGSCTGSYVWQCVAPKIESSSISNITSSEFKLNVDISHACTVYAVAVLRTATAPSSAQVKAGKDGTGAAASASKSLVLNSGGYSGEITFNLPDSYKNIYTVYFVAEDGDGITAEPELQSVLMETVYTKNTVFTSSDSAWANPDLEIDGSNNIYAFFQKESNFVSKKYSFRIAKWNGASWGVHTDLAMRNDFTGGMSATRADMAVDGNGHIHVLTDGNTSSSASTSVFYHNVYDGASWSGYTSVFNGPIEGGTVKRDFVFADGSNKIHVAFSDSSDMNYATNKSGAWVRTSLGAIGSSDGENRWTLVESGGTARVFYEAGDKTVLRMASSTDGFSAKTDIIDISKKISVGNVIMDSSNKIHIAYLNSADGTAFYKTNASGSWVEEALTSDGLGGIQVKSIMLHGADPYVLMYHKKAKLYYFKRKVAGSWEEGNFFKADGCNSFVIDAANDKIHLIFQSSASQPVSHICESSSVLFEVTAPPNEVPTLTSFVGPVAATNEDVTIEITFANLTSQGDEADTDGTVDAFVVKSVATGSLKIGTAAGSAAPYAATTNDTIDASKNAYWTPATNVSGTLNAFTLVAQDDAGAESTGGSITAQVTVNAVNDSPTLTSFGSAVAGTDEDVEGEITLTDLKAQGNEADVDGTVDAFVVKSVVTGSLKIGANAGSAVPYAATTNDTIDASNNAYWTPASDANGTLDAFTVVAKDDDAALSSGGNITAQMTVNALNDSPTDISLSSISVDEGQPSGTGVGTLSATDPDD